MEFKSLFLGLVFAMGIFGLKSGVGLHFFLIEKRGFKTRLSLLSLYSIVYLSLFMVCAYILREIDTFFYLEMIQGFLKSGMFIHVLMAGGLIVWGIVLLKRRDESGKKSYGWLAMIIPCPLCITVVFLSAAFILSWFPGSGHTAVLGGYLIFMGIVLITMISMSLWSIRIGSNPDSTLGAAMLMIAGYFILSIIIMPQFQDIDEVYRLAAHHGGQKHTNNPRELLTLYSIMIASFTGGFLNMVRRLRGKTKWI